MTDRLALHGGTPVREKRLPYGRQDIHTEDVEAVVSALRSDFLTTGPQVTAFEDALSAVTGVRHAVAVTNGTAALHAMMHAVGAGPGDEVIVPAITFAATGNAALYQGAKPVIVDVEPDTLLIDPDAVRAAVTPRTKAIVGVDYAGQPCDWDALQTVADDAGVVLLSDGCHSLGATYENRPVGTLAAMTAFSFHPVKTITTGEGGAVTTDDDKLAASLRRFRNHGFDLDAAARTATGVHRYAMHELGHNLRLSDLHAALGTSQLARLQDVVQRRGELAARYDESLTDLPGVQPLSTHAHRTHAHHLYVVVLEATGPSRDRVFEAMQAEGIGVNVHYIPLHQHPYYREHGLKPPHGCPVADDAYQRMLTLPLFPTMSNDDLDDVVRAMSKVLRHLSEVAR